jgi:hypothetical protein
MGKVDGHQCLFFRKEEFEKTVFDGKKRLENNLIKLKKMEIS